MAHQQERFDEAIRQMNASHEQDPRTEVFDGKTYPKELIFSQRVSRWLHELLEDPPEALQLAAFGHTLCRWKVRRDDYDRGLVGYRYWRLACANRHADEAEQILRDAGYDDPMVEQVRSFILKKDWPNTRESLALEDADCLAFLELKFKHYLDDWDEDKTIDILAKTARKMTPEARRLVSRLPLSEREQSLLARALAD
ncbi:MAG: DUF4202 domain-containing protein [Phycisphaerae bacterium]